MENLFVEEWGKAAPKPSARSDFYVHFWLHGAHFLCEGGYLGLLTGSGWLDNEYGFALQEFMLERFQVIAVLESVVEPWFTEARVNTAATILRRTDDPQARANNNVKFVLLRKKLSDLLPPEDDGNRQRAIEALVTEIETMDESTKDDRWRVRVVNQAELTLEGWDLKDSKATLPTQWNGDWDVLRKLGGEYVGSKWSIYLRAPDLFFEIIDVFGKQLVPLREIANVRRGITSGADKFFYVQDITDTLDDHTLSHDFALTRSQTKTVRVVQSGDGTRHLIEAKYLKPLVFNVMETAGLVIDPLALRKKVLLVSENPKALKGTHVLNYIRHGEREGFYQRESVASRASDDKDDPRQWYDLRPPEPGALFWPQAHQYRHIVPFNPEGYICNKRFFNIYPKRGVQPKALAALLNSTLTWFFKEFYARSVGREGYLDTDVFVAKLIPVAKATEIDKEMQKRLAHAFDKISRRPALPIYPMGAELEQADRVELDDLVLEALGVRGAAKRKEWRERIYDELKQLYKHKRELEEIAMVNRVKAARTKEVASARTLAKEIWHELDKSMFRRFPDEFVLPGTPTKRFSLPEGQVQVGRELFTGAGSLGQGYIMIGEELIFAESMDKAEFIQAWQEAGNAGTALVPQDDAVCQQALAAYHDYKDKLQEEMLRWARSRTADEKLQERVISLLWKHIGESVNPRSQAT